MKNWLKLELIGVLSIAAGAIALAVPVVASIAVSTLVSVFLLVVGVLQIGSAVSTGDGMVGRVLGVILGAVMAFLGLSFLVHPLEGVISLAMLVVILLGASGVIRLVIAFRMKQTSYFWPMLLSGAASVLLAGYILANFAALSVAILGILLGIELIFNGAGLIILGFFMRRLPPDESTG